MRIHLIKMQTIQNFVLSHAVGKSSFEKWIAVIKYADWEVPADIRQTFGSADLLGNGSNRVVFDIAGNNYRVICKYHFGLTQVHLFVCWIGTHAEYDLLCGRKEQYTVNAY
jgi:mRNA interferase HigB